MDVVWHYNIIGCCHACDMVFDSLNVTIGDFTVFVEIHDSIGDFSK